MSHTAPTAIVAHTSQCDERLACESSRNCRYAPATATALASGSCFQPVEHHEPCDAVDRAEREISEQQAEAGVEGRSTCVEPRGRDAACEWDALRDRGDNSR